MSGGSGLTTLDSRLRRVRRCRVIDVLVAARHNAVAARTFFTKHAEVDSSPPEVTTDRAPAYPRG